MIPSDLAPAIAHVLVEHAPGMMSTKGTLFWIFKTWPECSAEEALRAIAIADEILAADRMAWGV